MNDLDFSRIEWRLRALEQVLSKVDGGLEEKMAITDLVMEVISQAHDEGLKDAAFIIGRLADETTGETSRAYHIGHKVLLDLSERNKGIDE